MIVEQLNIKDFIAKSSGELIIDVRSPIEFNKGHMTNAVNIPLFEDAERAEIGTLYKQQGKETAVTRGLEIVSPKMVPFVSKVKALSKNKKAFVYCFRGGMRSNSFSWLLNTSGLDSCILHGGYKAYRNYVLESFTKKKKIILLGGKTGSGKTDILKLLNKDFAQVIDLEKLANHKGSAFGAINEEKQNPQQIFENNLCYEFSLLDLSKPIVLENESQNIGYNRIPHALWLQMKEAAIIMLEIPFELRVQKLVDDYTTADIEALKKAVKKIAQQLGPLNTKLCLQYLDEGRLGDVASLSLSYYDKAYDFSFARQKQSGIVIQSETIDATINAEKVKQAISSM